MYVEKPLAHNIWEGRKMVEAARKYKRIVQVGIQNRSAPYIQEAFDFIKSPVVRVTLPDAPAPASGPLEAAYYPGKGDIKKAIISALL